MGTWLYAAAPMGIKSTPSNWMAFLSKKLRRHGVLFELGMYDPKNVLDVDETKMNDGKARPHSYLQVCTNTNGVNRVSARRRRRH
jgi:hypothetical protein